MKGTKTVRKPIFMYTLRASAPSRHSTLSAEAPSIMFSALLVLNYEHSYLLILNGRVYNLDGQKSFYRNTKAHV